MTEPDQILLVEFDPEERARVSAWLEDAGFDVLTCPGPLAPDYTCVGGRTGRCPLAEGADLIILDLSLGSDLYMTGTPAWEIMLFYAELGRRLVILTGPDDAVQPHEDSRVAVLTRPVARTELFEALERLRGTDAA